MVFGGHYLDGPGASKKRNLMLFFLLLTTLLMKAETLKITALLSEMRSGWLRLITGKWGMSHTGDDVVHRVPGLASSTTGHGNVNHLALL